MKADERSAQFLRELQQSIVALTEKYQDVLPPQTVREVRQYTSRKEFRLVGFRPEGKHADLTPIFLHYIWD